MDGWMCCLPPTVQYQSLTDTANTFSANHNPFTTYSRLYTPQNYIYISYCFRCIRLAVQVHIYICCYYCYYYLLCWLIVDSLDMDVYMLDTQLYTLRFYAKELVFLSLLPLLNGVLSVMGVFVFLE